MNDASVPENQYAVDRAATFRNRASLTVLFGVSLMVLAGLFMTVHRRSTDSLEAQKSAMSYDRYDFTVQRWLEKGFFNNGGMFFLTKDLARAYYPEQVPPDSRLSPDSVFAYKNGTASYIIPLYWIQSIPWALNGRLSPIVTAIYNQFMIAMVAVALGILCLRICQYLELTFTRSLALAICSLISFQTFAPSVASYWEVSHLSVTLLFALLLLAYEFDRWNEPWSRQRQVVRAVLATLVLFGEPATGGLFLLSYLALRALTSERNVATSDVLVLFIVPALLVAAYLQVQHLLVRANQSSVFFVGSNLLSRSGLDGDATWYRDHWDLMLRGHLRRHVTSFLPLIEWPTLLFAGLVSSVFLITHYSSNGRLREPMTMLLAALGLYVPMAFVFSQAVYIHPYLFDVALVIPCVMAVFCLLPAYLESKAKVGGLATYLAVVAALGYALVQLRTYAYVFPNSS